MSTFGIRLRELREANNLTQVKLAKILFSKQNTVTNWEAGRNEPSFDTVVKLANLFNVSTDYLLGVEDKKSSISSQEISQEDIELLRGIKNLSERDRNIINTFIATNNFSTSSTLSQEISKEDLELLKKIKDLPDNYQKIMEVLVTTGQKDDDIASGN